jgi:hypothetical protein
VAAVTTASASSIVDNTTPAASPPTPSPTPSRAPVAVSGGSR